MASVMWGVGLLVDAGVRVLMSSTLPVGVVPGLGAALYPVTFVVVQVVTNAYHNVAGLYQMLGARWVRRAGCRGPSLGLSSAHRCGSV